MDDFQAIGAMSQGEHVRHLPSNTIWALRNKEGGFGVVLEDGTTAHDGCCYVYYEPNQGPETARPGSCPVANLVSPFGIWAKIEVGE
jgi:hypothetical protein